MSTGDDKEALSMVMKILSEFSSRGKSGSWWIQDPLFSPWFHDFSVPVVTNCHFDFF
jgi:hypothetical protein